MDDKALRRLDGSIVYKQMVRAGSLPPGILGQFWVGYWDRLAGESSQMEQVGIFPAGPYEWTVCPREMSQGRRR